MTPLDVSLDFGGGQVRKIGRLAARARRVFVEFAPTFLADPLPISPFRLEPRPGVIEGPLEPFEGLHGAFADSMPDAWGRLLLDRAFRRAGGDSTKLTPLDTLAIVGGGGAGALSYQPSNDVVLEEAAINLNALARDAASVLNDDEDPIALNRLRALGGTSGGARPKALLHLDPETDGLYGVPQMTREPWIVKFLASVDPADSGAVEFVYSAFAREAGLQIEDTRLFPMENGAGYFGTRRFDRAETEEGWAGRHHMQSLAGLLEAEYRMPSVGYDSFVKATRMLTKRESDAEAAFRLMVFNIAVHNRDDHTKNIAFLMDAKGEWCLAPAFDLTFSEGPGGEHSMDVIGEGRSPTNEHVMGLAAAAGIRTQIAEQIVEQVCDALDGIGTALHEAGATAATSKRIANLIEDHRRNLCR